MAKIAEQTAALYVHVIENTLYELRRGFADNGLTEETLTHLKTEWEKKIVEAETLTPIPTNYGPVLYAYPNPLWMRNAQAGYATQYGGRMTGEQNRSLAPGEMYPQPIQSGNLDQRTVNSVSQSQQEELHRRREAFRINQMRMQGSNGVRKGDGSFGQYDGIDDGDTLDDVDVDDELDSDLDDNEGEPETDNLMLCQYEKVQRTKNKWKVQLKEGMMHIKGHDIVFNKANGDFMF